MLTGTEFEECAKKAEGLLVAKPAYGSSSGLGVTTQIQTGRQLESAVLRASFYSPQILIERFVPGESVRLLFLNGELIHAVRRRGVRVYGDGVSSIKALLAESGMSHLQEDKATRVTLSSQGLSADSIVAKDRSVLVRHLPPEDSKTLELRTVYNETITDSVCDALRTEVARLVEALRCEFVGVDLVTNDTSVPLAESGGVFLEVNTTPGIHHHYHTPLEHENHPVAVRVLNFLLKKKHAMKASMDSQASRIVQYGGRKSFTARRRENRYEGLPSKYRG